MNREIINKVKKLLSLATSDNENEAKLAAQKAQKLLIEHNLKLHEAESISEDDYTKHEKMMRYRSSPEEKYILSILNRFFFVYSLHRYRGNIRTLEMFGTPENVEIATYIYYFLEYKFKSLYKRQAEIFHWKHGKNRNAFYLGLFKGLTDKLLEEQGKHNSNALMIINKSLINYVKKENPNIKNTNAAPIRGNDQAVNSGYEQGRKLNINKGLESKNEHSKTILLG